MLTNDSIELRFIGGLMLVLLEYAMFILYISS